MSVLKNKRRTSKIEYEKNFLGFYEYMMNLIDHMPKRWAKLHPKKTCIVKLTKGFTFLKVRYRASGNRTIKTLAKSGIVRMRRKLKKFRRMVGKKRFTVDDVFASLQSWITHARIAQSYHAVRSMLELYDSMYGGHRITMAYWKAHPAEKRKRKVVV